MKLLNINQLNLVTGGVMKLTQKPDWLLPYNLGQVQYPQLRWEYVKLVSPSGETCEMFNVTNEELNRRINRLAAKNYHIAEMH